MEFIRICNVDTLFKKGESERAMVILHGYGADYQDLAPLASYIDRKAKLNWYFLNGQREVDLGLGMIGRAWFPIDMALMNSALVTGQFDRYFDNVPDGLWEACENLVRVLREIKKSHETIYLGGFSQGSMVAMHAHFKNQELISKLVILSGSLVAQKFIEREWKRDREIQIFQSHGDSDPVLPIAGARRLQQVLKRLEYRPEYHEFRGGHEIPISIIEKLSSFLEV